MLSAHQGSVEARLAVVEEHIRHENEHDLDGILSTFAPEPRYEEQAFGELHTGRAGVERYYSDLLAAMPDLEIDVQRRHIATESIILEVMIRGTHLGTWRGLPATGRRLEFPLCAIYSFDGDKLAGERIYYDRATVFRQLGVFREPVTPFGRLAMAVAHPVTIARALLRRLLQP